MIILLTGRAGVGKDTVGHYLVKRYLFRQDSLAAPIKRLAADIFGIPHSILNPTTDELRKLREEPLINWPGWTPRKLLQYIGTELFRQNIMDDIWVRSLWLRINQEPVPYNWVITDVRFPNEQSFLIEHYPSDVVTINVERPGYNGNTAGGIQGHASEANTMPYQYRLTNDKDYAHLYRQVDEVMSEIMKKESV